MNIDAALGMVKKVLANLPRVKKVYRGESLIFVELDRDASRMPVVHALRKGYPGWWESREGIVEVRFK